MDGTPEGAPLDNRGRVSLPPAVRAALGVGPGDRIAITLAQDPDGTPYARIESAQAVAERALPPTQKGLTAVELLHRIRGEQP